MFDAVGGVLTYCPGVQLLQLVQLSALVVVLYLLSSHGTQVRSAVVEPTVLTCCPSVHVVQSVQLAAFDVVLNLPLAHVEHARLLVVVPGVLTN